MFLFSVPITIRDKPDPTINTTLGQAVKVPVKVEGFPLPDITWFRGNEKITSDDHVRIERSEETETSRTSILTIFTMQGGDVGQYKVEVGKNAIQFQLHGKF